MLHRFAAFGRSLFGKFLLSFAAGATAALGFLACGGAAGMARAAAAIAAALVSQQARQPGYNDFLRLIFRNLTPPPTKLGGPNAYRVFFGATAFYQPPVTVAQIADFSGIPVDGTVSLFVLRCIPPDGSPAGPVLATWPNVISQMLADYEDNPPIPGSTDEAILTIAQSFTDFDSQTVDEPLYNALGVGKQFFESYPAGSPAPIFTSAQMQKQVQTRFGTYPAFSGLGYAIEGTATGPKLTAAQAAAQMVVPEYILGNVTLAQAGCYCIQVPPYPGRDTDLLDPDYVKRVGASSCVTVASL